MSTNSEATSHANQPAARRVLVAMSGGVDSSVAAAMLRAEGCDVVGVFMRNGVKHASEKSPKKDSACEVPVGDKAHPVTSANAGISGSSLAPAPKANKQGCCSVEDAADGRSVADALGVPFYVLNFEDEFGRIIDYFVSEYRRGRTPNPCVVCNTDLKFGHLLRYADDIGAEVVATGHYAQSRFERGRWRLFRGADRSKDQSYYLFGLTQEQLSRCRFPLGHLTKPAVRALAGEYGLRTRDKPESMEICFVPTGDYRDVLRERAPDALVPGNIVDGDGRVIAQHGGAAGYTIGQRKGLGGGGTVEPLYVTRVDTATNTVVVGGRDDVMRVEFVVERPNFVGMEAPEAGESFRAGVQIRYRSGAKPATVRALADGSLWVTLDAPASAVTPGQACVMYGLGDGVQEPGPEECLGGGWIG